MAGLSTNDRLKYFSRKLSDGGVVNILLVSTSQAYVEKVAKSLFSTREVQKEKRSYFLQIHKCKSILEVVQFMPKDFYIDFIVFILDSHVSSSLTEMESNLSWLDSSFTREKICIVNPDFSYTKSAFSPAEIWDFARLHQLNLINGKTKEQDSIFNLTKRILNLVEASCGILNGIPMISVV